MFNVGVYCILDLGISILFYRSWIAFLLFAPGFLFFYKERKKRYINIVKKDLSIQFLTGMQSVSAALTAGYSVENAFNEALQEMEKIYSKEAIIIQEFSYITYQLKMNRNLEELLLDLANRCQMEDIRNFAEVFSAAKRTGGDLIVIIRNTVLGISQKEETRMEIETCLSAKRLEQRIMSGVPFMILIYVGITSPGFLDSMYHNPLGIGVMSGCLGVYLLAFLWGRKIVDIEV